jgi:hypothetical protein
MNADFTAESRGDGATAFALDRACKLDKRQASQFRKVVLSQ